MNMGAHTNYGCISTVKIQISTPMIADFDAGDCDTG